MYATMSEIRQANKAAGQHWFDPSTMRFFGTRIETSGKPIAGYYFVSSEQYDADDPRLYTVRKALDNGHIETVGEFRGHATYEDAVQAAATAAAREE